MAKAKTVKVEPAKAVKRAVKSAPAARANESEQLMVQNLSGLTKALAGLSSTVEAHVQKTASIANHVIAIEELLAELVAMTGVNLARVNNRIRARIASGTTEVGAAEMAIDCAASIAAPSPRI
jgi:hypothetical protein